MLKDLLLAVAGIAAVFFGGFLMTKPVIRLLWFVGGALVLLNTTSDLSLPKLAYMLGVVAALAVAIPRCARLTREPEYRRFRPAFVGALTWTAWILLVTLPYSVVVMKLTLSDWIRDAFTQLMVSVGVILGIDGSTDVHRRTARLIAVCVGLIAAGQFAVTWTSRRGLEGDGTLYLFGSKALLAVPIAMGLTYGLARRNFSIRWLALTIASIGAVLLSGTRSGVLFLTAFIGVAGSALKARVRPIKAAIFLALTGAAVVASTLAAGPLFGDRTFVQERLQSILQVAQSQSIAGDMSGQERRAMTSLMWAAFQNHPMLGQGVGSTKIVDTPVVYLGKLGILGTLVLLTFLASIWRSTTFRWEGPWLREMTVSRGAITCWVFLLLTGPQTEDKGFGLAISLLIVLLQSAMEEDCLHRGSLEAALGRDAPNKPALSDKPSDVRGG